MRKEKAGLEIHPRDRRGCRGPLIRLFPAPEEDGCSLTTGSSDGSMQQGPKSGPRQIGVNLSHEVHERTTIAPPGATKSGWERLAPLPARPFGGAGLGLLLIFDLPALAGDPENLTQPFSLPFSSLFTGLSSDGRHRSPAARCGSGGLASPPTHDPVPRTCSQAEAPTGCRLSLLARRPEALGARGTDLAP